ncbi:MAG: DUF1573 domain-containing protein [bacterium]
MKNDPINSIIFLFHCIFLCSCSSKVGNNNAFIRLNTCEHNFGTLQYKKETEHIFEFTNPGKTPLIITSVKTSCGCTAADWTKHPVKPGKSGQVTVKYDAAFPGVFQKTVTVHYNGKDSPVVLKISGQVEYPEDLEEKSE